MIDKFRTKDYVVHNLFIVDERNTYLIGDMRLCPGSQTREGKGGIREGKGGIREGKGGIREKGGMIFSYPGTNKQCYVR